MHLFELPQCLRGNGSAFNAGERCGSSGPWVGKILRRNWRLSQYFCLGESQGQRSLSGYSSWGRKESGLVTRHAGSYVTGGVPSLGVTSPAGTGKSLNHPERRKILLRAEIASQARSRAPCLLSSTVDPRSLQCFQPALRTSETPLPPGSPPAPAAPDRSLSSCQLQSNIW